MKTALSRIKSALQLGLPYIKARDIYVTEDIRLIRAAGGYPAIGIKDGPVGYLIDPGDQDEVTMEVTAAAYVQLLKPEAGIMGDEAVGAKGVLAVAEDIIATLRNNDLNGWVASALPESRGASELLSDGQLVITMVPVVMRYTRYDTLQ